MKRLLTYLLAGLTLLSVQSGAADPKPTLTLTPSDDATVRETQPATGYGEHEVLEVDAASRKDILLRFELRGIGSSPITRATLRLFAIDASPAGGEVAAVRDTTWRQDTLTWQNAPAGDGEALGSFGSVAAGSWYELDVTPLVTGDGPVSFRISSAHENGADYASKEHSSGNAPQLIVTLEPAATRTSRSSLEAKAKESPVSFAAAGDFGGRDDRAGRLLQDLKTRDTAAFLLLGDVSYSELGAKAWCDWVKAYMGEAYALQLLTGNHEDDDRKDGFIRDFTACLPDRLNSALGPGGYGVNYAFDLGPVTVIATAPDVKVDGVAYRYDETSSERRWLTETIRAAKANGDWVIVGMHKNCITIGKKPCEIGAYFAQHLIDEGVDLVLQGHEHNYQRTHALNKVKEGQPPDTIADEGTDGFYARGVGTVFVIVGTAGRSLYPCSHDDAEYPYFAAHHCAEESASTKGYLLIDVSTDVLSARFIATAGSYSDAFSIR